MPDTLRREGIYGRARSTGLYGALTSHGAPAPSNGTRDMNVRTEQQTSMRIARGVSQRETRNHKRIDGVFSLNMSPVFRGPGTPNSSGLKYYQAVYDPAAQAYLHLSYHPERKRWAQTPQDIMLARRISDNRGRSARIEPRAPQQVAWKVPYVVGQRNVQPIGPYQSLKQRSILYRLSDVFSSLSQGR